MTYLSKQFKKLSLLYQADSRAKHLLSVLGVIGKSSSTHAQLAVRPTMKCASYQNDINIQLSRFKKRGPDG